MFAGEIVTGSDEKLFVVVMGVSGTGKSTIARELAKCLGWSMLEGDDFHPASNISKMSKGEALDDDDREDWLTAIRRAVGGTPASTVLSCSALKRAYRDRLRSDTWASIYLHLRGPHDVIAERIASRVGHFMSGSLLDSQLATLECLEPDELGIELDVTQPIKTITTLSVSFINSQRSLT